MKNGSRKFLSLSAVNRLITRLRSHVIKTNAGTVTDGNWEIMNNKKTAGLISLSAHGAQYVYYVDF